MGLLPWWLNCALNCSNTLPFIILSESSERAEEQREYKGERRALWSGLSQYRWAQETKFTGSISSSLLQKCQTPTQAPPPLTHTHTHHSVSNAMVFCVNDFKIIFPHTPSPTLMVRESAQSKQGDNRIQALRFMTWKTPSWLSSLYCSLSSLLSYSTKSHSELFSIFSLYFTLRIVVLSACWISDC